MRTHSGRCGQGRDVETVALTSGVVDCRVDELTRGVVNVVCGVGAGCKRESVGVVAEIDVVEAV